MNKIKIYFFPNKAFISPPWATSFPEDEADKFINHDIEVDLRCQRAILRTDYMSSCTAEELDALAMMLQYAAHIIKYKEQGDIPVSITGSDCDVFVVRQEAVS